MSDPPSQTLPLDPAHRPAAVLPPAEELSRLWRSGSPPDLDAFLGQSGPLSYSDLAAVLRVDQRRRWELGQHIPAEHYLGRFPKLMEDRECALDFIYSELLLREKHGEHPGLEGFLARFPELAEILRRQIGLHRALCSDTPANQQDNLHSDDCSLEGAVGGRYEIIREIGRGGTGVVYEARQTGVSRVVALKLLSAGKHAGPEQLFRFRAEAKLVGRLQHPNIVQIYEAGEQDGFPFLALEFMSGGSLRNRLNGAPQPPDWSARLVEVLARAVHAAHQAGIVHRDLKPGNVLFTSGLADDSQSRLPNASWTAGEIPKIADFGLAKALSVSTEGQSSDSLTQSGDILGTPSYMSPEQAAGRTAEVGPATDIYALGAILYELLTGRPPFHGVTVLETLQHLAADDPVPPSRLLPRVPRDLEVICLKCLEKSTGRRYPTALALATDLERFLNGLPVAARRLSKTEKYWRWCRRNPGIATLTTGLITAVVAGFIGVLWQWSQAELARERESFARTEADHRAKEIEKGFERLQAASAHVDRARVFWQWRRGDDALEALNEAIALRPDLGSAWAERARVYAELGLWEFAAADERRAFEYNEPSQITQWWSYAVLLASLGDVETYHRVCQRMESRFTGNHAGIMIDMLRTLCVIPNAEIDYSRIVHRVQTTSLEVPQNSVSLYATGLAHYRAGQFRDAVQKCEESQMSSEIGADQQPIFPVLALAYRQLGEHDNARANLAMAKQLRNRWIEQLYASGEKGWGTHKGASANWPVPIALWLEFDTLYREARNDLQDHESLEDPRLRVLRARAFAIIGRYDTAEAEYQLALAQSPHDDRIRMERHRNEAYRLLHRSDFSGAAHEFAQATKLDANDAGLWLAQSEACLEAGNPDAHRRLCREMFERFGATRDPWVADKVVWSCTSQPDSLPDMAVLESLAAIAIRSYSGATRIQGAMWVRAGRYAEALGAFEDAANLQPPNPWDWSFRAIAHDRLGQTRESRHCLEQAAFWIKQADLRKTPEVEITKPCWKNLSWYEHAATLRLFDEARALINQPKGSDPR
jgi:serine/threonine-protein kinase